MVGVVCVGVVAAVVYCYDIVGVGVWLLLLLLLVVGWCVVGDVVDVAVGVVVVVVVVVVGGC